MTLRQVLQLTTSFLSASVATETGLPLVQRLSNAIPPSWTPPQANLSQLGNVIVYSLHLLETVNTAVLAHNTELGIKDWRQVNALVEIVVLLGLYKSLTAGVGVPQNRRVQSILLEHEGRSVELSRSERTFLIENITLTLKTICAGGGQIGQMLQRKNTVDILSGLMELSFNPLIPESDRDPWTTQYEALVSKLSLESILASFTAMLHSRTPCWLRAPLTRKLSSIPLDSDRHGLRIVVQFLLGKQQEPSITQFDHIGKVIGSVPSWTFAEEYVERMSTQILDLLDEKDPLLQKCGVCIISFLFRNHPALVERDILVTIRKALLPSGINASEIISDDESRRTSLRRLEVVASNSTQPLISSTIRPLLQNLFLLSVYTHESHQSNINTQTIHILTSYLASSPSSATDVLHLVGHLSGTSAAEGWMYTPGETGGIAIRRTTEADASDVRFDEILVRVAVVVKMIEKTSEDVKSEIFVGVIRRWLSPHHDDALLELATAQLLQELLSKYQTELLNSPVSIIQVCGEILSDYLSSTSAPTTPVSPLNIVHDPEDDEKNEELLEMALRLLSTSAAESVQRELLPDELSAYETCLHQLESLSQISRVSVRNQAKTLISLIKARLALTSTSTETPPQSDAEIYSRALEYISDPLVPIRAQGLSLLRDLILRNSSAVNVDSVLDLLLGLLHDEDSYVYLNAIKAIQVVADKHDESITRKLMSEYESRADVDERVRLAEAIAGVIQRMGQLFSGPFAREIITRSIRLVSTERDWRVRVSALGLLSVCCELAPMEATPAIDVALHLFRVNDLTFAEEGDGASPLRRGAVAIVAAMLRGGGIDALGSYTKEAIRSVRYLARSDGDDTVRELAQGVMRMFEGVIEPEVGDSRWSLRPKIQEL